MIIRSGEDSPHGAALGGQRSFTHYRHDSARLLRQPPLKIESRAWPISLASSRRPGVEFRETLNEMISYPA